MSEDRWWQRTDLAYSAGRLQLGGADLEGLARSLGTPLFVYSAARVLRNLDALHRSLERASVPHSLYYALKANRHPSLLTRLRMHGGCGLDVCSPNELRLAREMDFGEQQISYTGTSVSERDLELLTGMPLVHVNCDSLSSLRRLGRRCPGRTVGLRINPRLTATHLAHISYAGEEASKFGIFPEQLDEAVRIAREAGLVIDTLHFHAASGYLDAELPQLAELLKRTDSFLARLPDVKRLNIGGGLGVPIREGEPALDLDRWASILAGFAVPRGLHLQVEPGDFLVKDAGLLLVEVNTVERKGGTMFVGVDAGFNLSNLHAFYQYPYIIAPLLEAADDQRATVTIAGNINEGIDLLAQGIDLSLPQEGDYLAIMNLGGYSVSSSSNHCMRGDFREYVIHGSEDAAANSIHAAADRGHAVQDADS